MLRFFWHAAFLDPARLLRDPNASLANRDLRGLILSGAKLDGRDLRGADLRTVPMDGASLCGADLRGARMCFVSLRGADFRGADLTDADLQGADLRGAVTDGVRLGQRRAWLAVLDARACRGLGIPDETPDWLLRAAGLLVHGREGGVFGGPTPEALARLEALDRMRAGMLEALFALSGRPGAALDSWEVMDRLWHRARAGEDRVEEIAAELGRFEAAIGRVREGAARVREGVGEMQVTR